MDTYNCAGANNSAYGAGNYNTCDTTTGAVGAPNTGDFGAFLTSAAPMILAPLMLAILLAVIVTIAMRRRKKTS